MEVYIFVQTYDALTPMQKDLYQLPRIQEALESLVSACHFSCLDLKSRFWQIKMDESLKNTLHSPLAT